MCMFFITRVARWLSQKYWTLRAVLRSSSALASLAFEGPNSLLCIGPTQIFFQVMFPIHAGLLMFPLLRSFVLKIATV